ncbi:MAG: SRPBCC family protein [Dehalococcoidia bacterium]
MARLDVRTFIAAAPEVVWDVVTDLERQRDWMVDLRALEIVSEAKIGAGVVMHVTSELFGMPVVKDVMTITAWEPPHRMDVSHSGQFSGTGAFILERIDNGTIFTWIEEFAPPLGPLGEAGFALVVRPHMARVFRRSLANVKRIAEERAGGAGASSP